MFRSNLSAVVLLLLVAGGLAASGQSASDAAPVNFASAKAGATVSGPRSASGSAGKPMVVNDEDVVDYGPHHGYAFARFDVPLLVTLAQEQTINKIELLLLDIDPRAYNYRIAISRDGESFRTVADRTQGAHRGWQTHVFEAAPCRSIRVTFTDGTMSAGSYHVVELAAYHQEDPSQPSPLVPRREEIGAGKAAAGQALFQRVFGEAAKLDPALVDEVKALPPGQRLFIDGDDDGKNDEVWFMDTATRHTIRPMLVRAVDEDGDLDQDQRPDLDSDLYVVDWHADGYVDAVLDYEDEDGDNDVDTMMRCTWVPKLPLGGKPGLRANWARDDGDDNLLQFDVNWGYMQGLCQYRCHFSGDESFTTLLLPEGADEWMSAWENPFLFFDKDRDGASEVALRIEGLNDSVRVLRYSFDADGDAWGRRPYDYDFSVSAYSEGGPDGGNVKLTDEVADGFELRGIPVHRVLRRDVAEDFVREAPWGRTCLAWDEMNANTETNVEHDPNERWEGLIAHGSENFPRVGGPPCSALNKRYEVTSAPARPLRLYYDPTDHRLHLRGAAGVEGWIHVDYDLDGKADAKYIYLDDDGDGILDRRQIDLDADGKPEFDWEMTGKGVRHFKLEYGAISAFYTDELAEVLKDSQRFIDAARAGLGDRPEEPDAVETFFLTKLESWHPLEKLGRRMRSTPAGARYYVDLVRDRLLHALKQEFGQHASWQEVEAAYAGGAYATSAEVVLAKLVPDAKPVAPERFLSFTHRVPVSIDNSGGLQRENWPVALPVDALRELAADFSPDNCAVVAPNRWIDWREVPHQVDALGGTELTFLADIPANTTATWYVYYAPTGTRNKDFPPRTGVGAEWDPDKANVGWESTLGAYRSYYGQFDFFGKHAYKHSRRVERLIYPLQNGVNYHQETEWGIDALHVGETSGLGGLTLYVGDREYPVQNPAGKGGVKFTKRVLFAGPIRAAVEITAANVIAAKPDLTARMVCIIYAEHQESEVRVSVTGAEQSVLLAPGLIKLPREQRFTDRPLGCLGTWGHQQHVIGDVGMALIVPPDRLKDVVELDGETRLKCEIPDGTLRYWVIGDWRQGRRFPVAPTVTNWRREIGALAGLLHRDARVTIGRAETAGGVRQGRED